MSKMNELSTTLDGLTACAEALADIAQMLIHNTDAVRRIFSSPAEPVAALRTVSQQAMQPASQAPACPVAQTAAQPTVQPIASADTATETKSYSFTEVRGILAEISGKGHGAEVRTLIAKYGAAKLSEVKPEAYPELIRKAEAIAHG